MSRYHTRRGRRHYPRRTGRGEASGVVGLCVAGVVVACASVACVAGELDFYHRIVVGD